MCASRRTAARELLLHASRVAEEVLHPGLDERRQRAVDDAAADLPLRAGMSTSVEIDTGYKRPVPAMVKSALSLFTESSAALAAEVDHPR